MDAMRYFSFLLASSGLAFAVLIFLKDVPQVPKKPFLCPFCLGFWSGLSMWWAFNPASLWFEYVVQAFAAASFSWFLYHHITGES